MYPHRIRLRGPWEYEPLAGPGPLPPAGRMTMPGRWGAGPLGDFTGRVLFRRRFGYPGRIDATERVWLTFAGVEGAAAVWLNDKPLGRAAAGPFEFEVTALLRERNELRVEVEAPDGRGGLYGEVALEVRCTAFLRPVRVWTVRSEGATDLHVAGEVVGTCERALDLYVLVDNATVLYAVVEAAPEGRPFHLVAPGLDKELRRPHGGGASGAREVRIELVNGATVWYRIEQPLEM